jgi:hypothetical protein
LSLFENFGAKIAVYLQDMHRLLTIVSFVLLVGVSLAQGQVAYDAPPQEQRYDMAKAVQIFPNPAVEYVHVKLDRLMVDNVKVTVHNIIGNEISIDTERISEHELRIRVKDFDTGYYLLAIKDDQSKIRGTFKFLKR